MDQTIVMYYAKEGERIMYCSRMEFTSFVTISLQIVAQ